MHSGSPHKVHVGVLVFVIFGFHFILFSPGFSARVDSMYVHVRASPRVLVFWMS